MKRLILFFCLLPAFSFAQTDFSKADGLVKEKKYKKAKREYSKIIKKSPSSYQAYLRRANLLFNHLGIDKSIADYSKVIELNDTLTEAYSNRGLAYYFTSMKDDPRCMLAIEDFDRAIELRAKNSGRLYYARGHCKAILDRHDKQGACADYLKAKELGYKSNLVDTKSYCGW